MKDMTSGNPLKLIIRFALPLLLGNLLQQLYNVADAAIVGHYLGSNALAAVGVTSSVQFLIFGFCIGSCTGFCVPIAQKFGAKDYKRMRSLVYNSILLTILLSVIITAACVILTPAILKFLSTPADIWEDSYIYIIIMFSGIPFTLLYNLSASILRAMGNSRTPFLFLSISTVTNIFLDYYCVAILNWGCAGAAAATVASQAFSGILCAYVLLKKYEILHMMANEKKADRKEMKQLLLMGIPMGLQFSITAIGSMVMQSSNNALGSLYVSAFTAASRIKMFAMCPFDAIATGVATFCSQNYGAGKIARIRKGYHIGTIISVIYGLFAGSLLIIFGKASCLIFLSSTEDTILSAAGLFLNRSGFFFWVLGLLNLNRTAVQGLGYSGRAMISGVMEMIARISVVVLFVPAFGFEAICLADPAAWIAADFYIIPTCLYVLSKLTGSNMFHHEITSLRHKVLHKHAA